MLETVRARFAAGIAAGQSLPAILASKPSADLDERFEKELRAAHFVDRVYTSLKASLNAGPAR